MGADQNFFEIRIVGLYPKITANPSPRVYENSYGRAISQQHTLENFTEAKLEKLLKSQHSTYRPVRPVHWTGQTGRAGIQKTRPVRPVSETGQTGIFQTARDQSFKRQIMSKQSPNSMKLGGKLRNYPKRSHPKDSRIKRNRGKIEEDWGFLKNTKSPIRGNS